MLLQFSVSNFLSFNEDILLNMIPVKSRTKKDHIIHDNTGKEIKVLPIAIIYGANASGKTNLVRAIEFARNLILEGTRSNEAIGIIHYLLEPKPDIRPSKFEFVFKYKGIVYTYGFLVSSRLIHEEWLFAYYTNRESLIFERITKEERTKINPGSRLCSDTEGKQFLDFIAQGTRPNQLFLTEANEKNIPLLKPVIEWFEKHLFVIYPNFEYRSLVLRAHQDKDFIEYLSKLLHLADTGINKIRCVSQKLDWEKHLTKLPEIVKKDILANLVEKKAKQILIQTPLSSATICRNSDGPEYTNNFLELKTEHLRSDGSKVDFDLSQESDGTRRLINLAPMLLDMLEHECVFFIDELDRSLHTHISRLFIETCLASLAREKIHSQFILTTHDTNLLDRNLLRRDEIWFIEKNQTGASQLTSLANYKVSEGLNYENGYLNGRFGAIPKVRDVKELMKEQTGGSRCP